MSRLVAAAIAAIATCASPAQACMGGAALDPRDVAYADLVVIGRISGYRIVASDGDRRGIPAGSWMPDYARFEVIVDEVLKGEAPGRIIATWDNSTFEEPKTMPPGRYLIALRRAGSAIPPLRGPSATVLPSPEPAAMAVLQAPCAPAFIFAENSREAGAVRTALGRR